MTEEADEQTMRLEGRWAELKHLICQLEQQGWIMVDTPQPNDEFTLSSVEMRKDDF